MSSIHRLHIQIHGAVQGVGFRPFVYRLATEMHLNGWVLNSSQGVFIEVEGQKQILDAFLLRVEREKPPRSFIQSLESSFLDPAGFTNFEIRHSDARGEPTALVLPDIATCPDCLREVLDPSNRRFLYPFTNCTNCGPRFSIIESLPYDRANTTMKKFEMCDECRFEYENPLDRRFHAQPNACSKCGPHLEIWDCNGAILAAHRDALSRAADEIRKGKVVAVKGLGGFHLMVDAGNDDAVCRLRQRKHREEKPLAVMYPTLQAVRFDCNVSELEERLLLSPESPIVLLTQRSQTVRTKHIGGKSQWRIAPSVAPGNPYLGAMLPYTPLHHVLMRELGFPVVATSGNLSDEPICTGEHEALKRLNDIADIFLIHNRPIARHVDDSIVRMMTERELVLRRARGYAPLPIQIKENTHRTPGAQRESSILAVGAHLKNTIALTSGENVFISQHIGDLETKEAYEAFQTVITSFKGLYSSSPSTVVADAHPAYLSSQYAGSTGKTVKYIQHHYAHVASCMAENQLEGRVLGVSWDGTGYGLDGTVWGGEFLLTDETSFKRVATFKNFLLPGGERSVKEPRRTALGVLYELFGDKLFEHPELVSLNSFSKEECSVLHQMLKRRINSPLTSSVGRLFDAVASMIGIRQQVAFEGQAAMELEFLAAGVTSEECYPFSIIHYQSAIDENQRQKQDPQNENRGLKFIVDWKPTINSILEDLKRNVATSLISVKFHNTLIDVIIEIARCVGEKRVVLSGGCFQNKYLTERAVHGLEAAGFRPYWHQRVPPNDGGIALGQIAAALKMNKNQYTPSSDHVLSGKVPA